MLQFLVFVLLSLHASSVCHISLSAEPQPLNYPLKELPTAGASFSETFFVNYTGVNRSLTLQYFSGSWYNITSFGVNYLGFSEIKVPVTAYWAHFGKNELRVVSGSCESNTLELDIVQANGVGQDALLYFVVLSSVFLILALSKLLPSRAFVALMLVTYFALSPFTGQRYDMFFLISSGVHILEGVSPFGNSELYPFSLKWAYPPLYPLWSALSFAFYSFVTKASVPQPQSLVYPGYLTSTYSVWRAFAPHSLPLLAFLLKLPMLLSVFVTYFVLSKKVGQRLAATYWLANPLVILVGSIWGQLDPLSTAFALLSFVEYERGRAGRAHLYAALGASFKIWPALLIPFYMLDTLRKKSFSFKQVLPLFPVVALNLLVYAFYGSLLFSLFVLVYARGVPTYAGQFSVNGLTWQWILYLLNSPPIPLFLYVAPPSYVALCYYVYKRGFDLRVLIFLIVLLFLTYNYVNPQYFVWLIPFFLLLNKRVWSVVYSVLPMVFVFLSYNLFYFVSPSLLYDYYAPSASILEELKLWVFYQVKPLFLVVVAIAPTTCYLLTEIYLFKKKRFL
ncbi:hypothetical protein B9Q12_02300 [Candidatus Marsarchaeota G2 archaeon ECH_B_SAG-G06]|uniref:DUF2029 domain-containing protein n=1 Tax=Candidatus Marsarchaeota G2 archaeon ECH_B_SAG-G06 TaxID=1978166 RepID=A0A2R6C0V7_9ARCH|nr:MAG: hypothetical protein B9Q12_02300 [Candidatus Marsarchaeota G2 archaeon ECH_B_SAG-G06]